MTDPRVEAIRNDPTIGRGSCSTVDECYTDLEVAETLDAEGIATPRQAVRFYRQGHDIWEDVAASTRN